MAEVASNKIEPSRFLSGIIGTQVSVKLNNGVTYLGSLQSIDGFMNIVLDSASEYVDGKPSGAKYGDVFIRGNNGTYQQEDRSWCLWAFGFNKWLQNPCPELLKRPNY